MISPDEARRLIAQYTPESRKISVNLSEALGMVLAEPAIAPHDHPFFDQSAMDGYAVRFADLSSETPLIISGEIPAGCTVLPKCRKGEALRIFTGAPVPESADTIVIQEHTSRSGNELFILKTQSEPGKHIRKKGEQIKKGGQALGKGTVLNPAAIGYLASIGIALVEVYARPKVGLITTGNEFANPEEALKPGLIFESNGAMLKAALQQSGIQASHHVCGDDTETISKRIIELAEKHQLLLITGGVSVGDYDFTPAALEAAGFQIVFHKVNQKPGKPLLFAVRGNTLAFGLPGNPRSVLSCFYLYVHELLQRWAGIPNPGLKEENRQVTGTIENRTGKTLFLTARIESNQKIIPLRGQNSHMLQSFAEADALIEIPPDKTVVSDDERVKTYKLPE